jgi:TATA-box binding protein (TBP) (component of TFIID and TFIIIB)
MSDIDSIDDQSDQSSDPSDLSDLAVPIKPPVMEPLKLVTMTINSNIDVNLNLDVIARHTILNDQIKGVSYRNIIRGKNKKLKSTDASTDEYYRTYSISGRFKNQCSFIIDVGDKEINTKMFNNGKMVNVGCMAPEHAIIAANILRNAFINMEGLVIYTIPSKIISNNIKKFFKDDLRKKFGDLIQLLACEMDMDLNLEPFNKTLLADDAYTLFQEELQNTIDYQSDVMYIYTIINILKSYYNEQVLLDHFNDPEFKYILAMIINHTNRETGEIACVFPAYLNNKDILPFDTKSVRISLINKSTNCKYYLNRAVLVKSIMAEPNVLRCTYDKNRYPGVITLYKTPTKDVKIILFNTGKINITSTRTHEQVQQAYEFISAFCHDNFSELLLTSEYRNKIKEYEDNLPIQHDLGNIEGRQYYLLKKSSIISHPRNVRYLNMMKLLKEYCEK